MICGCSKSSTDNSTGSSTTENFTGTFVRRTDSDTTAGGGSFSGTLNRTTQQLTYTVSWHTLTSIPVEMHFHDAGPVIIQVTGFTVATAGSLSGTAHFTSSQIDDMEAGSIYFMIHTERYTDGEIVAVLHKE